MKNFSTPHCHPQSLDTATTIPDLAKREIELGTGTITATDHGSMAGCRQVYDLARTKGLTPILGLEGYFRDDDCPILLGNGAVKGKDGTLRQYWKYGHVTLHYLDQDAYETGCRVLSRVCLNRVEKHGQESKPVFRWADLEELGAQNLTLGSGCLGGMIQGHLLERDDAQMAVRYYERLRSTVKPGNFLVEVFPHACTHQWKSGVVVTLADGTKKEWYDGKKLLVDGKEVVAKELKAGGTLQGVKNYFTWEELPHQVITGVLVQNGFVENECRPWGWNSDIQAACNRFMLAMAARYGDPVVLSDDSHFANPEEKIVQDVRLSQKERIWKQHGSYHRQSAQEAYAYFAHALGIKAAEFEGWLANNEAWAARFKGFELKYGPSLPTKFYPADTLQHTKELIHRHQRMNWADPRYVERLKAEITLLHQNGTLDLLPYFFLAEEVCRAYNERSLLTGPGRGSAAGLLLAYLLEITHVDPLRYNLSLERFLTLSRIKSGKLPDIDLDFPHRDLLVSPANPDEGWLADRFGDHFAQISVDTTVKLKSAIRDVSRATRGSVPPHIERLCKQVQVSPQNVPDRDFIFGYVGEDGTEYPGSIHSDKALQEYIRTYPQDWEIVQKSLGVVRQKGRHASAFVIANKAISSFLPLMRVGEVPVTQYSAGGVEAAGGIKMDFLVVKSLRDISDAIQLIRDRSGVAIPAEGAHVGGRYVPAYRLLPHAGALHDVWDLPEDMAVFNDIVCGRTETVFQFNTDSAVGFLKLFAHRKPNGQPALSSVNDLASFTALDRPGPLDAQIPDPDHPGQTHNVLVEYNRRARGLKGSSFIPAFMTELFPETYGLICFQEQLQYAYQHLTDCSPAEAEEFRINVSKKKMDRVEKAWTIFGPKAEVKLGSAEKAREAWSLFVTFGRYGFNRSHAVCYALIGYVCAYLKHYFPLEWWCAVLRNADKGEIVGEFWPYCGHLVDLPDLRRTIPTFEIVGDRIASPVRLLNRVGGEAHNQMVAYAPYQDVDDFLRKIKQHKAQTGEKEKFSKTDKKTGVVTVSERFVEGHSAINWAVARSLILAGVMDGLFPPEVLASGIVEQLQYYRRREQEILGTKEAVVEAYLARLDALSRYQSRKGILPAYAEDLRETLLGMNWPNVVRSPDRGIVWKGHDFGLRDDVRLVDAQEYRMLNRELLAPTTFQRVAAIGLLSGVRPFTYTGKYGTKTAIEFSIDLSGTIASLVAWPGRDSSPEDLGISAEHVGAVVVILVSRNQPTRPFQLDHIRILREPRDEEADRREEERLRAERVAARKAERERIRGEKALAKLNEKIAKQEKREAAKAAKEAEKTAKAAAKAAKLEKGTAE